MASASFAYGYFIIFFNAVEVINASENLMHSVFAIVCLGETAFLFMFLEAHLLNRRCTAYVAKEILLHYEYGEEKNQDISIKDYDRAKFLKVS